PLPSPPDHLLHDPQLASTITALGDVIKVETPFNIDRFQFLLHDHPNQPFVMSVMRGLREGFWPFDLGEWDEMLKDYENFASEEDDLAAIRAFRDKELSKGHWSNPLQLPDLLHGMHASPLFVVWQKTKGRVITDHSPSGLNDGIPREDAKVRYDDMRTFG
ncbi:hypothetical protein BKA70DRAFT_1029754, partial [Coprinopsis sp. MPI-PUGE-AT-0042]